MSVTHSLVYVAGRLYDFEYDPPRQWDLAHVPAALADGDSVRIRPATEAEKRWMPRSSWWKSEVIS